MKQKYPVKVTMLANGQSKDITEDYVNALVACQAAHAYLDFFTTQLAGDQMDLLCPEAMRTELGHMAQRLDYALQKVPKIPVKIIHPELS